MALVPLPKDPLPIVWQNTVVDIEPTSRYGDLEKTPDTASINTTLVLRDAQSEPVTFIAPGHWEEEASARLLGESRGYPAEHVAQTDPDFEQLMQELQSYHGRLKPERREQAKVILEKVRQFHRFHLDLREKRVVRFFTRLPIIKEADGSYKFSELVPWEFTQLVTHGDLSVVVLLPRGAQGYDTQPLYNVSLESFEPADSQVFGPGVGGAQSFPPPGQRTAVSWYWKNDPVLTVRYRYS